MSLETANTRIKILRKDIGLSQLEFAEKIGIRQSYLSMIESGKKNVSKKTAAILKEKLSVSTDWLLKGKGEMLIINESVPKNTLLNLKEAMATGQESRAAILESDFLKKHNLFSKIKREYPEYNEAELILNSLYEMISITGEFLSSYYNQPVWGMMEKINIKMLGKNYAPKFIAQNKKEFESIINLANTFKKALPLLTESVNEFVEKFDYKGVYDSEDIDD